MNKSMKLALADAEAAVERMAEAKCPPQEYLEALEALEGFIEIAKEAVQEDINRLVR